MEHLLHSSQGGVGRDVLMQLPALRRRGAAGRRPCAAGRRPCAAACLQHLTPLPAGHGCQQAGLVE